VGFVTVTHVEVTPDLRRAIVYYTALGDDPARRRTRAGLVSAAAHLRTTLGHQVKMRYTPEVEFEEDVGLTQVERVSELLKQIESESKRDRRDGDSPPGPSVEAEFPAGGE
jgi:ribosome-binding factor A